MGKQRILLAIIGVTALILLYLLQGTNYSAFLLDPLTTPRNTQFIINRIARYILNDLSVIVLLWALFQNRNLIKVAFGIQIFGLFIVLPLYFYFKLSLEGPSEISSPLLSFIHRIVVNPILLLLLIPAFYYQKRMSK